MEVGTWGFGIEASAPEYSSYYADKGKAGNTPRPYSGHFGVQHRTFQRPDLLPLSFACLSLGIVRPWLLLLGIIYFQMI
jgi:hypothetical protein